MNTCFRSQDWLTSISIKCARYNNTPLDITRFLRASFVWVCDYGIDFITDRVEANLVTLTLFHQPEYMSDSLHSNISPMRITLLALHFSLIFWRINTYPWSPRTPPHPVGCQLQPWKFVLPTHPPHPPKPPTERTGISSAVSIYYISICGYRSPYNNMYHYIAIPIAYRIL